MRSQSPVVSFDSRAPSYDRAWPLTNVVLINETASRLDTVDAVGSFGEAEQPAPRRGDNRPVRASRMSTRRLVGVVVSSVRPSGASAHWNSAGVATHSRWGPTQLPGPVSGESAPVDGSR